MSSYGNGYNGFTAPVKRTEQSADEKKRALFLEYVDLLQNMVETTVSNKSQWYAGESVHLTKTMFLSNDSGLIRLHHIERKGGTTVGFLSMTAEFCFWRLTDEWKVRIEKFAEWITVSKAGEQWENNKPFLMADEFLSEMDRISKLHQGRSK